MQSIFFDLSSFFFCIFIYCADNLIRTVSNIEIIRNWRVNLRWKYMQIDERENFFSLFFLHGLSLAILISRKDLVPPGRLKRITLHTNHRKEFLQRAGSYLSFTLKHDDVLITFTSLLQRYLFCMKLCESLQNSKIRR